MTFNFPAYPVYFRHMHLFNPWPASTAEALQDSLNLTWHNEKKRIVSFQYNMLYHYTSSSYVPSFSCSCFEFWFLSKANQSRAAIKTQVMKNVLVQEVRGERETWTKEAILSMPLCQWDSSPAQYDAQNKVLNAQSNRKSKYVEDLIADTHVFPCTYRHFWGKVRLHCWFKLLWIVSEAFSKTLYGEHSITLYNDCFYYKTCNI